MAIDSILFLSFGGPEGMDEVMPFLQNVLRGKNVPEARMKEVAHHYELFGGVSPLNAQNRRLIEELKIELKERGIDLPVYFGNRNWHPLLADTLRQMHEDGKEHVLTFVTSAYSSYSGCRQYLEDIERASAEAGVTIQTEKIRAFYNHPLFIEANRENVEEGLKAFGSDREKVHIAFTAHSIPLSMAATCKYEAQLNEASSLVAQSLKHKNFKLVYQSRSGPPTQPWLEPDILAHIRSLHEQGIKHVLVHPIGFISDHMEIIYDLDIEAKQLALELGMKFVRSSSSGTNPHFGKLMGELVEERLRSDQTLKRTVGENPPEPDRCAPGCCAYTAQRPQAKSAT